MEDGFIFTDHLGWFTDCLTLGSDGFVIVSEFPSDKYRVSSLTLSLTSV